MYSVRHAALAMGIVLSVIVGFHAPAHAEDRHGEPGSRHCTTHIEDKTCVPEETTTTVPDTTAPPPDTTAPPTAPPVIEEVPPTQPPPPPPSPPTYEAPPRLPTTGGGELALVIMIGVGGLFMILGSWLLTKDTRPDLTGFVDWATERVVLVPNNPQPLPVPDVTYRVSSELMQLMWPEGNWTPA